MRKLHKHFLLLLSTLFIGCTSSSLSENRLKATNYYLDINEKCNKGDNDSCLKLGLNEQTTQEKILRNNIFNDNNVTLEINTTNTEKELVKICVVDIVEDYKQKKESCYQLGLKYVIENDKYKAKTFLGKSCDLGYGKACYQLGMFLYNTSKDSNDILDTVRMFQKGHKLNDSKSSFNFGYMVEHNSVTKENYNPSVIALKTYIDSCNLGYQKACEYIEFRLTKYHIDSINESCKILNIWYSGDDEYIKKSTSEYYKKYCLIKNL